MRDFSKIVRAAAAGAFGFGAVFASRAQEKSADATSAASSSQPDAITGAKKDFESIKSSRDAALQPKGELPRMTVPEWQSGLQPSPSGGAPTKIPTRETKSANWLLDAMEKQSSSRHPRVQGERENDRERDRERESRSMSRERALDAKDAPEDRRFTESRDDKDPKKTVGAVNPLARYLESWMTPKDYALLKPGLADSLISGTSANGQPALASGSSSGLLLAPPGSELASGALALATPAVVRPAPRENPFLPSVGGPESAAQVFAAKPRLAPVAPPPVSPPPSFVPPPLMAPQTKIPEFAKPATDEKYFKPLKRF